MYWQEAVLLYSSTVYAESHLLKVGIEYKGPYLVLYKLLHILKIPLITCTQRKVIVISAGIKSIQYVSTAFMNIFWKHIEIKFVIDTWATIETSDELIDK